MLNSIKKLINPDVVLNIATGNNELVLKESGAESKIKKLHIKKVPADALPLRWIISLAAHLIGGLNSCPVMSIVPTKKEQIKDVTLFW